MTVLTEIAEQPTVVERLVASNRGRFAALAEAARDVSHVVVAARGTSDNAARYAQYVWGARNRLSVGLTTPSLFGIMAAPPNLSGALVVGVSQSGQSPDLVDVLTEARRQDRPTIAITNDVVSPLAKAADTVVDLAAGPEMAVAATKTYTAELAAVALTSLAFSGHYPGPLAGLVPVLSSAVADASGHSADVAGLVDHHRSAVVARGFHHATAHEWALKLQELAQVVAHPFSAADFLHGPLALIDAGFPVLAVVTAGATEAPMREALAAARDRGAHIIALTDVDRLPADTTIAIPAVEPWLSPIVAAPYLQHFTVALALARRLDPDRPRGLTKITRTR